MFNFTKKPAEQPISEPIIAEQPKSSELKDSGLKNTVIGPGVTFVGDFDTTEPLKINGAIKGSISSSSDVLISKDGEYYGNANVYTIKVDGLVDGNVFCKDIAELSKTAVMKGDLNTARLVTSPGSTFLGNLKLDQPKAEPEAPAEAAEAEAPAEVPAENAAADVAAEAKAESKSEK